MIAGQSRLRLARSSNRALVFLAVIGGLFLLTFADAAWLRSRRAPGERSQAELAKRLGLTDLCLLTEARYICSTTRACRSTVRRRAERVTGRNSPSLTAGRAP